MTGLEFVADAGCGSEFCTHDTYFWGMITIATFNPGKCIHIFHMDGRVEAPTYGQDTKEIPLRSRVQQSYYWVWAAEENDTEQFEVIYNGQEVTTCQVSEQRCAFSLPSTAIVNETIE